LEKIVVRSARLLNVEIDGQGAHEIARRSRGTPRIANNLLRRVRDYAQVRHDGRITADVADKALAMLEIDQNGLDEMDKRILEAVIVKFGGGPVGVNSLAVAVGEEPDTISRKSMSRISSWKATSTHLAGPRRDGVELQKAGS
jgi:Holliday junction DNA helicase RuvB